MTEDVKPYGTPPVGSEFDAQFLIDYFAGTALHALVLSRDPRGPWVASENINDLRVEMVEKAYDYAIKMMAARARAMSLMPKILTIRESLLRDVALDWIHDQPRYEPTMDLDGELIMQRAVSGEYVSYDGLLSGVDALIFGANEQKEA